MRYDILIIWGNGLSFIENIISEIRDDTNFKIVRLKYHEYQNTEVFLKDIYSCDTAPWEHLKSKSNYLTKEPKNCMVVLVKNLRPKEKIVGSGQFTHKQCQNLVDLKTKIRSLYNPKFKDRNKKINPLPTGVSHDHCIHSTDYEEQTDYLLNYFEMNSVQYYNRYENLNYNIPYHLTPEKFELKELELTSLRCNIIDFGFTAVKDSPHYKYVTGNISDYCDYVKKNIGYKLQEDHFIGSFDKLIKNFKEDYLDEKNRKQYILTTSEGIILDGTHRASILISKGIKKVKCLQIK